MPASLVLVDTSVFVEFFRGRSVLGFADLVAQNLVLLSDFVRLELLAGVRRHEVPRLGRVLSGLRPLPLEGDLAAEVEAILGRVRTTGLSVGLVDLLIAAQARRTGSAVMSLDRVFAALAARGLIRLHAAS